MEMLSAVARELLISLFTDLRLIAVYALIVLVFVTGYRKYAGLNDNIGREHGKSKLRLIEETILTGLVCGFILSILSVLLGMTISAAAVEYFLITIIILVVINIRYVGFIYVGGVLVIVNTITGSLNIDSVSLIALMGLVQLTEALLIFFYGKADAIPVYIKHKGRIAGAFVVKKAWPIPVVFFTYAFGEMFSNIQQGISAEWWTLINFRTVVPAAAVLGLDCLIAVAGYWDVSIAESPGQRSKKASFQQAGIGAFLLAASFAAYRVPAVAYISALLAVAAKEGLVFWGRREQKRRKPLFSSVDRGLKLLEVFSGGNAEKIGLEKGDTIMSVNGRYIQTTEGLKAALDESPRYIWINVKKPDGSLKTLEKSFYPYGIDSLGILVVPRESEVTYNIDSYENLVILRDLVRRFRGGNKGMKD